MAKRDSDNGVYPSGYGNYPDYGSPGQYPGYGTEEGHGEAPRDWKEYLAILREKFWYILTIFLVLFTGTILYTFRVTPEYTSSVLVEIFRDDPTPMATGDGMDLNQIASTEDLNTELNFLQSSRLINAVNDELTGDLRVRFLAPYEEKAEDEDFVSAVSILARNREVELARMSLNVIMRYTHPSAEVAAAVANLFAEEYVDFSLNRGLEQSLGALEDLRRQAGEKKRRVEELEQRLAQYRRDNDAVSVEQSENVVQAEHQAMAARFSEAENLVSSLRTRLDLVRNYRELGRPLWELDFIAARPLVQELVNRRANAMITIEGLSQRYREKHPEMIEARRTFQQVENELEEAVGTAVASLEADLDRAVKDVNAARQSLARTENRMLELAEIRTGYNTILREFEVADMSYREVASQLARREAETDWKKPQAMIVDRALPPGSPSFPNIPLNLAIGGVGGLGLGIGFALLLGFLDQRVKTIRDIMEATNAPLLTVIPLIRGGSRKTEAPKVNARGADTAVTEAFRSLYSSIRLSESGRDAQVLLVTSASPGEGKSLVTVNLGLTLAGLGKKVLLLDGDFRLPTLAKQFGVKPERGVHSYFYGDDRWEDSLVREVAPGVDLLGVDRRIENPTQVFNSMEFEELLIELRQHYDAIVLDSPPVGAVSDVLCMLPVVDGVIFVIKYNQVKKNAVRVAASTLRESEVPLLGSALNGVTKRAATAYYQGYYGYQYKNYYARSGTGNAPGEGSGRLRARHREREGESAQPTEPAQRS
jgi:capsular exopolysaccharide synthesis family protein